MRLRMSTATEVRRTLARVANMLVNDEITTSKANSITLIGNAILNALRTDEQQAKLDELEILISDLNIK